MALRRVDRLRAANIAGVPWKFARKLARPPDCFRDGWAEVVWFRPYWFLVRAGGGVTDEAFSTSEELDYGGLCPHPPRNLRFLGTSICCRLFGRGALRFPAQAQAATTAAQRRQLRTAPHQKRTAAGKRRPPARSPRHSFASAVGCGHCPPASSDEGRCKTERRRKPRPPRRSAVSYEQPRTRNAPQRASRHHGGAVRVSYCAAAVGCGHCPPTSSDEGRYCISSLPILKFPHRRSCQTKPSLMEGSSTMMKWPTSRMVS